MSTDAITTVGGLWSAQILDALRDDPSRLSDTDPTDYKLPPRYQLREATRHSWGLLGVAWADFDRLYQARVEAEGEQYGGDRFTIDRWLTHLWQQLGYSDAQPCPVGLLVDGGDEHDPTDRYPISLLWHDRLPILQVPAGTPLDRVTASATGGARRSPHAAMQDYLNRTSRHLWGIVTNGLTLRLLRNNAALTRQAYVEFDLVEMFRDDNFPSFAVLWLALHASRFDGPKLTDVPAERWQSHALDTGVRALTTLRQGVENAILALGQALIAHPDNRGLRDALTSGEVDGQGIYRELLYVAYRHVFLFAVEDRGLLHADDADPESVARYRTNYSTARLREQARRHTGGSHPDGWAAFQALTGMLADPAGQPLLALPPLLGALWDAESTPHLNSTTIPNRAYYKAIYSLAFVRQEGVTHRIDYRNLGAEELGAVYESLLEIIIDVSPTERRFSKRIAAGSDRKTTGSYYTPTSLIKVILDEALDPVIEQAVKGLDGEEAAQALLNLTVCDPAMGSGHFLVAAAHRLAKQVAAHRTSSLEPDPVHYRQALRDVTSRCIYGVDLNPMAVELAKISLWIECHVPGQPLTFLDHHLKCGNALLGVGFDRDLIAWRPRGDDGMEESGGVPDAAFKAITGDDTSLAKTLRSANKTARAGALGFLGAAELHEFELDELSSEVRGIAWMDDTTPEGLAAKQQAWMVYGETDELRRERLRADAWTACWTIPKMRERIDQTDRPHDVYYDSHYNGLPSENRPGVVAARREAERLRFFHWYVEFPEIADEGGFSCLLGNPPWERIKLQEKEWFASEGYEEVATAGNGASRKRAIAALAESNDEVDRATARRWQRDSRDSQATSEFVRMGGRFPLGGVGDVNTYALFSDHFFSTVHNSGRVGIITPTGLLTDYSFRKFASALLPEGHVVVALGMSNAGGFFPGVSAIPFMLLVLAKTPPPEREIWVSTGLTSAADWQDRAFQCSAAELVACNPNTKTLMPVTSGRALGLLLELYRRLPPLEVVGEGASNPWDATFPQPFHMTNDSGEFRTEPEPRDLPLLEGKMVTGYNYRATRMLSKTKTEPVAELDDPDHPPEPHYWVSPQAVDRRTPDGELLMVVRLISSRSTAHTLMSALVPRVGIGNSMAVVDVEPERALVLVAMFNSHVLDFVLRNKIEDANVNIFVIRQLPMPPPDRFLEPAPWGGGALGEWLARRAAGLSGCARPVSDGLGLSTPVIWDEELRRQWRTEIDAAAFHLFGLSRSDTEFVLDTFPVIAARDRQHEGLADDDPNWRTKRLILAKYDELAEHARTGTTYVSPDPPPPLPDKLRMSQA